MRLLVQNYLSIEASLGSPGIDEIRWPYPVRPGDTLRVRATVIEARQSLSKPDRGIIKTLIEAVNDDGRTAMRGHRHLLHAGPPGAGHLTVPAGEVPPEKKAAEEVAAEPVRAPERCLLSRCLLSRGLLSRRGG